MWDNKFNRDDYLYGTEPNRYIESCSVDFQNGSKIICFGEGEGRNSIFFAKNGFQVTALDASRVGLDKAKKLAENSQVEIETVLSKIEDFKTSESYDYGVSSFMHLHRDDREAMFNSILNSLKNGGLFVGEFFSSNQLSYSSGGPKDIELLYSLDETKDILEKLNCKILELDEVLVDLNEGEGHRGEASVIRVKIEKI